MRRAPTKRLNAARVPDPRFGRFCIGCGCCDEIACDGGCDWIAEHVAAPVGVCSQCRAYLPVLRELGPRIARAIYRERAAKAGEWL